MLKENKTEDKSCLFYVSDYHFEMIALPYMKEKIENNNQVIVMTQENLEDSMKHLLDKVNLDSDDKKKIEKINWKEKSVEEISEIDTLNNKVVFVKGTEKYIKNVNQKINEVSNVQNLQVIDCYDVNNVDESIIDITKDYNSILSTSGLKNL
ncbi:unknown [Clostridium sp. CAG:575]|nr:unknown [Clostridium sp. CAG:575]